ncbi:MAG: formate dehydrogenase accessory sulfurtransferase FdhD [Bacteroidales bacterium]|nr:formate dehydrogenase accessory sulfurtransferase FdhD [Bacteroidales bacterium]
MKQVEIIRFEDGRKREMKDYIIREVSLRLVINGQEPILLPCSGWHVNELITGYLYTNGYIHAPGDIQSLDYNMGDQTAHIGLEKHPLLLDDIQQAKSLYLPAASILQWMDEFSGLSEVFRKTGAVHTAAVASQEGIHKHFEDISRHNAIEMLIGWSLMQNEAFHDKCLMLSCRISRSIINKAVVAGFPMIVSTSPPTDQALDIARENNIALAGFARGKRMNVYCGTERFTDKD